MSRFSSITWLTIITFSIGLFFLWLALSLSLGSGSLSSSVLFQTPVLLELNSDIFDADSDLLIEQLKSTAEVNPESIELYDENQALLIMDAELIDSLAQNPFSKVISFKWHQSSSRSQKEQIIYKLENNPYISGIYTEEINLKEVQKNVSRMRTLSFSLLSFLSLFSVILLYNVNRIFLHKDEKKVKTMMLVGAEPSFILKPYLRSAVLIGATSFALSFVLFTLVYILFFRFFLELSDIIHIKDITITSLIVMIIALLLPMISTYMIINLYLRKL